MNDEINKLLRERHHWERRIVELGGPNYKSSKPKTPEIEADTSPMVQSGPGYKYFGAAKNLPGVKELFESPEPRTVRKTRAQMHHMVDIDYYGFRDEDDGSLLEAEEPAEDAMRESAEAEFRLKVRSQPDLFLALPFVV